MNLGFKPLGARVLVEKYKDTSKNEITIDGMVIDESTLETTSSGFVIPKGMEDKINLDFKRTSGKILAMGTGLSEDAKQHLKVGTVITFQNPHTVSHKGDEYYLIHENNINLILD